jgi:hypothetical protein
MPLHRDIFWVGKQWAVTGSGIQAVDQRLRGVLDIEIARLWDNDFIAGRRAKPGINLEDFDKALALARTRYPQAQEETAPTPTRIVEPPLMGPRIPFGVELRTEGTLARFLPQWRIRR